MSAPHGWGLFAFPRRKTTDMELVATTTGAIAQAPAGPVFLLAEFIYDSTDPAAIYLKLDPIGEQGIEAGTTWVFGRELLDAALASQQPVGVGDVRITALDEQDQILIELIDTRTDEFSWTLRFEVDAVIDFMIAVLHAIPEDAPSFDVDDAIAKILGASA